jgi:hypothetical protein
MVSITIESICVFIKSEFLVGFLTNKIVEIQITLIAINTATSSFIVSKLEELSKTYNKKFTNIYKEIKASMHQQIILIVFSILLLTIRDSGTLSPVFHQFKDLKYIFGICMIFSFSCSIDILRDTGTAMFNVLIDNNKTD